MSVLYNRLKNVEKEKKPETPISEEEGFPIEGEIKRQKFEQRRRRKWGIMGGMFLFFLLIFIGALVMSIKEVTKNERQPRSLAKILSDSFSSEKAKPARSPKKAKPVSSRKKAKPTSSSKKVKPALASKKTKPAAIPEKTASRGTPQLAETETPVKPEVLPKELFEQGIQLYKQQKYKEAVAVYVKGLQDNPQQAVGYNNLGVAYYKQGKLRKSSTQLKLAVELDPRYAEAHYNLAVVLEKLGREKEALIHYLKFLEFASQRQKELQNKVQTHIRYYY